MMKPQVALPFCLWAAVTGRWRVEPTAALTMAALWETYCLRVGAGPLAVLTDYVRTLRGMYSGPNQQVGVSELARLAPDGAADVWTIAMALALCALLGWMVARQWRRSRVAGQVGGGRPDLRGLPGTLATLYRLVQRWGWSAGRAETLFVHFDRGFMLAAVATLIVLQWRPGATATEPARVTP